jgi:hypothetical protein
MKEHIINAKKNSFIAGWYIDPLLCDELLCSFKNNEHKLIAGPREKSGYEAMTLDQLEKDLYKRYFDSLRLVVEKYKNLHPESYESLYFWQYPTNVKLQKYKKGKFYSPLHCENPGATFNCVLRHLVFMTYLNTIDEGENNFAGGTEFPQHNVKIKAEKGLTLIWPVAWTHMHRGIVSEQNEKYIATSWLSFPKEVIQNV